MKKEILTYSDYKITQKEPSKYVNGLLITVDVGVTCPACGRQNELLDHGDKTQCECGLNMQSFGNTLEIWK